MGKSPGKWIKGILFGKKTPKSNSSRGRELSKSASERPARVSMKEQISTITVEAPLISNPVPSTVLESVDNSSFDKGVASKSTNDLLVSSSTQKREDISTNSDLPNDSDEIKLEQAATVVQSSFRSYQAQKSFRSLKGIIKLQAVVRGHLVRRQAIATLVCVRGIVKLQAITRGHIIRQSSIGNGRRRSLVAKDASCGSKYNTADTLLKSAFAYKLLSSSPTAKPLHPNYGHEEPNSAWDWLVRWSISQFWAPISKHNEKHDSKLQVVEMEQTKPQSNSLRVRSETVRNDPDHACIEKEELKHKGRKLTSQPVKSGQDHPHDRSKCFLKKTPGPVNEVSNVAEVDVGKPKRRPVMRSKPPNNMPAADLAKSVSEQNDVKSSLELPGANSPINELNCHLALVELPKLVCDKSQDFLPVDKDIRDDQIDSENCKPDDQDATSQTLARVPRYMATTTSSKAKVKGLASPRSGQNAVDKNGLTRRHSLPSSTNGKLSSSPRVHRLVLANAREGIKADRSLTSSRDVTDKAVPIEWQG